MQRIKKAVIPAAGLGTRFLPATKAQPKEMLPIVDTPAIQYVVEEAKASGIEEILIITGRNKRSMEDHFDRNIELEIALERQGKQEMLRLVREISGVEIHYIRQKEMRGLGDAIYCAKTFIGDEPFAVLLGDDIVYTRVDEQPCLRQLMECYYHHPGAILGVQEVAKTEVHRYGILSGSQLQDGVWKVDSLVEKPSVHEAPSRIAVMGRYVLPPEIFAAIEQTVPGVGGEIQITDAITQLSAIYGCPFRGIRYDVGDKLGYLKATVEFALRDEHLKSDFTSYLTSMVNEIAK